MEEFVVRSSCGAELPHIVLFDLYATGHHPQYILNLVEYWVEFEVPCRLTVVAPPELLVASDALAVLFEKHKGEGLRFIAIDEPLPGARDRLPELIKMDLLHGKLLRKYAERIKPNHIALMYFDHCQLSLAFGLRFSSSITLSGIYFRPTFHFRDEQRSIRGRIDDMRKKTTLRLALRNPHLEQLFCLDPFVVPMLNEWRGDVRSIHLPDGVRAVPNKQSRSGIRSDWGVDEGKVAALLFGVLNARKGVHEVLRAAEVLTPDVQERLHIVFVGPVRNADAGPLKDSIERIRNNTEVDVFLDDRYVPDGEVQGLVEAADVILLPYQREHVGSSNMLIRAAMAGKPVIGTNHGLLGRLIDHNRIGETVESADLDDIASALRRFVSAPKNFRFDPFAANVYGVANTSVEMGQVFFYSIIQTIS